MLTGAFGNGKNSSLLSEYASLLGDAVLRHRARVAEHSAQIEADLANKVKSEFVANMSHELRTPLNTVIGFSKILGEYDKRQIDDRQVIEYANLIHGAAEQLLTVINGILDISKIHSGRFDIELQAVSVDELLRECLEDFREQATSASISLSLQIDPDLPSIYGDQRKLKQAFGQLLDNAIKFTTDAGEVVVSAALADDGTVAISVRDTGVGMTGEEVRVALSMFGQVDGGRTRWREGVGLGLPVAKALFDLHDGKIEIRSAKSVGTVVTVNLPSSAEFLTTEEASNGAQQDGSPQTPASM